VVLKVILTVIADIAMAGRSSGVGEGSSI
jgi:hypothetical protein